MSYIKYIFRGVKKNKKNKKKGQKKHLREVRLSVGDYFFCL